MNKIKKVFACEVKQVGDEKDRVLRFIGSDETPDRDDDIIEVAGWDVSDYMKNPVFLWAHEYEKPPIGKAVQINKDLTNGRLVFDIKFPTLEELSSDVGSPSEHAKFIDTIYNLYRGGYLSATSVGFHGIKFKPRDDGEMNSNPEWQRGRRYMEQSLLELSAVPVPSNPNALQQAKSAGIDIAKVEKAFAETKTVILYKAYPTEPEGTEWDGPAEIAAAEVDDLKIMATWYDAENPDAKQSYKLPHHRQSDKHLIWRGVMAAMGVLLGARGGVDIPEADRKGVYNHLAKHYDDFGKTAPEFKNYTEQEIKSMFPQTKIFDLQGNPSVSDIIEAIETLINPADMWGGPEVEELYPINYPNGFVIIEKDDEYYLYDYTYDAVNDIATLGIENTPLEEVYVPKSYKHKSGAQISAKNRETLQVIHDDIHKCYGIMEVSRDNLKAFIDGTMPMMGPDGMPMMGPMMTAQMTAPMMEPMMSATRTAEITEIKQALDEIKSQVSLLLPKDAPKVEIDLDAIELPKAVKDPAKIELNIEPGELKTMIQETIKNLIQGGNQ